MLQQFTPLEYLMIDAANHQGFDDKQYEERIEWVDQNWDNLEDFVTVAEKPELYLAAVIAIRSTEKGEATGHLVGFDAAASGLQIMAALTGCYTTAINTGLVGNTRKDIYSITTTVMAGDLNAEVDIERKLVKSAQMPMYYGSEAKPKEVFGEGTEEYNAFFRANKVVAPGAFELLNVLLGSWVPYSLYHDWTMADGYYVYCPVMAPKDSKIKIQELGKEVSITYRHEVNCGLEKGVSNAANATHSIDALIVREMGRRCNYSPFCFQLASNDIDDALNARTELVTVAQPLKIEQLWRESGFMSLVGIDHIVSVGGANSFSSDYLYALKALIERTMEREPFEMLFIHDEFKALANDIQTVRQTYAEIMAEIADSKMLSHILSQIAGEYVEVNKLTPDLSKYILNGNYAIC